jgi:hypothetical protein
MNKSETVRALLDAIQKGDFEGARTMFADEFRFSGSGPEPLDAKAWLGLSANWRAAFPDLDYHFIVVGADENVVTSTAQLSGTHTGDFDLSDMDIGVIPATHKSFAAKLQRTRITVQDGKITSWAVEPTAGTDLLAILQQLEVYISDLLAVRRV